MLELHDQSSKGTIISTLAFCLFNIIFRDLHEILEASTVNIIDILAGLPNGNQFSDGTLLISAVMIQLPLLEMLLLSLLNIRWARISNLVIVPLAIVGTILTGSNDPDDYFFTVVEISAFIVIFVITWGWLRSAKQA